MRERVATIPAIYLNNSIFIGNAQIKAKHSIGVSSQPL
jgi:hypothetical protein